MSPRDVVEDLIDVHTADLYIQNRKNYTEQSDDEDDWKNQMPYRRGSIINLFDKPNQKENMLYARRLVRKIGQMRENREKEKVDATKIQLYKRQSVKPKEILNKHLDSINTNMLSRYKSVGVKGKKLRRTSKVVFGRSPAKRDDYDDSWPFEMHPQRQERRASIQVDQILKSQKLINKK